MNKRPHTYILAGGVNTEDAQIKLKPGEVRAGSKNYECVQGGGYRMVDGYERFDGRPAPSTATTALFPDDAGYKASLRTAQGTLRTAIQKVPGSGSVLGVVSIATSQNNVYAFRLNAGATAVDLYRNSGSGWTQVTVPKSDGFSVGSGTDIADGTTITQGANTATILGVTVNSGTFGAGTALGTISYTVPTPGAFVAGAATTLLGTLTLTGNSNVSLGTSGGEFDFIVHNFTGDTTKKRIYYAHSAQGIPFELRPPVSPLSDQVIPIYIPGTTYSGAVSHVAEHLNRLFVTYGASVQYSATGLPFNWSVVFGAGELALGEEVTAMRSLRSDALCVTGLNTVRVLLGTSLGASDFRKLLDTTGCTKFTLDEVNGAAIGTDRIGTYFLEAAQEFGNFKKNALSRKVERLVAKRTQDIKFALVCKNKSQYRIFFNDMTGITATFDGTRLIGWFPFTTAHQFTCGWVGDDANGDEVMYVGTSDGYVMQLDKGTSHDGTAIQHVLSLAFDNMDSVTAYKRFYTVRPDVTSTGGPLTVSLYTETDYGLERDVNAGTGVPATGAVYGSGTYGGAYYGAAIVGDSVYNIDGIGFNVSPIFVHEDDIDTPCTFEANTIEYALTKARK